MIRKMLGIEDRQNSLTPKEGDLFKKIKLYGKSFEIRYGFYEECDRHTPMAEPVAIYPDFIANPIYTDDGTPFVTQMQAPCDHFDGVRDDNSGCADCMYYCHGDELIGTCLCSQKRK